jgi:hypothetical protein
MRDIETIDGELRLVSRARVACVLRDRMPSTALIDELLDERAAARRSEQPQMALLLGPP